MVTCQKVYVRECICNIWWLFRLGNHYSHISIIWLIIWVNFDRFRWPLIIWVSYHFTEFFFFKFKTYHYFIIFQNFWISAHRALTLQAQSRFWKRVHTEIYKFYQNFIIWLSWFLLKNTLIIWVSYHMSELNCARLRRAFIIWLSYHIRMFFFDLQSCVLFFDE